MSGIIVFSQRLVSKLLYIKEALTCFFCSEVVTNKCLSNSIILELRVYKKGLGQIDSAKDALYTVN